MPAVAGENGPPPRCAEISHASSPEADGAFDLGYEALQEGRAEEAAAHLRRALDLDPAYNRVRYYLAQALLRSGRASDAAAVAEEYARGVCGEEERRQAEELARTIRRSGAPDVRRASPLPSPTRTPWFASAAATGAAGAIILAVGGAELREAEERAEAALDPVDAGAWSAASADRSRARGAVCVGVALAATGATLAVVGLVDPTGRAKARSVRASLAPGAASLTWRF